MPAFQATDQYGKVRDFNNLKGANGLVVLFFKSADWCPVCQAQLIQLQQAQPKFKEKGIGLAAISYDTPAILKTFSSRREITFPLLADPQSKIIQQFGLLNPRGMGFTKGMAIPGFFYVNGNGVIKDAFFAGKDNNRYTPNSVIAKLFPQLVTADERNISALHLGLRLTQSDAVINEGNRATVIAEISLPPDVHVYAPGVQGGYKPIVLALDSVPGITLHPVRYPKPTIMLLPVIGQKVPVFNGTFHISENITVDIQGKFAEKLGDGPPDGTPLTLNGKLYYQACSSKICYPPTAVPVSWTFTVKRIPLHGKEEGNSLAGRIVFQQHCQTCHGQNGEGTGKTWTVYGKTQKIRALNQVTPGMSDGEMRNLIEKGYGPIQPVPGLDSAQVKNVIAYIRSLEK